MNCLKLIEGATSAAIREPAVTFQNETKNAHLSLPLEIWFKIFNNLNFKELNALSMTCQKLHAHTTSLTTDDAFWKKWAYAHLKPRTLSFFASFEPLCTFKWKMICRAPKNLSNFLERSLVSCFNSSFEFITLNPLHNELSPSFLRSPFTSWGAYRFSIMDSYHILVTKRGASNSFLLKGDRKNKLAHLAACGSHLFAVRTDHKIVVWNFEERKKLQEYDIKYSARCQGANFLIDLHKMSVNEKRIKLFFSSKTECISRDGEDRKIRHIRDRDFKQIYPQEYDAFYRLQPKNNQPTFIFSTVTNEMEVFFQEKKIALIQNLFLGLKKDLNPQAIQKILNICNDPQSQIKSKVSQLNVFDHLTNWFKSKK